MELEDIKVGGCGVLSNVSVNGLEIIMVLVLTQKIYQEGQESGIEHQFCISALIQDGVRLGLAECSVYLRLPWDYI